MADTTTGRGLLLPCPQCGEPNACMLLDLSEGDRFSCQENDCEFRADDVRDLIKRWGPVLAWVEQMPAAPAPPEGGE
jgi:hypothetical protein